MIMSEVDPARGDWFDRFILLPLGVVAVLAGIALAGSFVVRGVLLMCPGF